MDDGFVFIGLKKVGIRTMVRPWRLALENFTSRRLDQYQTGANGQRKMGDFDETSRVMTEQQERTMKLPKTLYVKRERDGDHGYFVADTNDYGLAEHGEKITIGTYKLVETKEVELVMKSK
jgi:hypothetical protein